MYRSVRTDHARRDAYLTSPVSFQSSQATRRQATLLAQQDARQNAFAAARSTFSRALETLDDPDIDPFVDAVESDEEQTRQVDADGDVDLVTSAATVEAEQNMSTSAVRRRNRKRNIARQASNYQPWARNLLMQGEALDELPTDLYTEWTAIICPSGKRCLCVSDGRGRLELFSRVSGRTLGAFVTTLAECYLDSVYDETNNTLFAIDIIRWGKIWYLDYDVTFRFFFLASRLSEHSTQSISIALQPSEGLLAVRPVPTYSSPLSHEILADVMIPSAVASKAGGILLYLTSAQYESGITAVAAWIPKGDLVAFRNLVASTAGEISLPAIHLITMSD